jgi:hypothetical protein
VAAPVYEDGSVPVRLGAPDVTLSFDAGSDSPPNVESPGDMDGDGFDDMVASLYDRATGTMFVHLRYGGPRPGNALQAFDFAQSGARLIVKDGDSASLIIAGLHAAGDIDGDGYADLFVQTMPADGVPTGAGGYLLYGGPERLAGTLDLRAIASQLVPVPAERNTSGWCRFAALGDIDGDGFDDIAMTNPSNAPSNPSVYVYYGRAARFGAQAPSTEAELQLSVADRPLAKIGLRSGGDIDGDGYPELLMYYEEPDGSGVDSRLIVLRGSASRLSGARDLFEIEPQMLDHENRLNFDVMALFPGALGDLDGDGYADFHLETADGNLLFYGGPELFAEPLSLSRAAATVRDVYLMPVGDRDGDGDDDVVAMHHVFEELPEFSEGYAAAMLSGSRSRLSGDIALLPEPQLGDAQMYPDDIWRYTQFAMPAGDLDNDGATEIFTRSELGATPPPPTGPTPQLHIHYGVHVPPATPDAPR